MSKPTSQSTTLSEGISLETLRDWLRQALGKLESGFNWLYVEDVFSESDPPSVIYSVHYDNQPSKLYERTYTLDGETITLADTRSEVRRKAVEYEPITEGGTIVAETKMKGEEKVIKKLEGEEKPKEGEEKVEEKVEPDKPADVSSKPADTPKPPTEEEQINALPSDLRAMVRKYQAQESKEREQLITQLSKRQKAFTVKELEGKSTEELEKLVQLAGGDQDSDFSGRILVSGEGDEDEPREGVWTRALKKQRERNSSQQAN